MKNSSDLIFFPSSIFTHEKHTADLSLSWKLKLTRDLLFQSDCCDMAEINAVVASSRHAMRSQQDCCRLLGWDLSLWVAWLVIETQCGIVFLWLRGCVSGLSFKWGFWAWFYQNSGKSQKVHSGSLFLFCCQVYSSCHS